MLNKIISVIYRTCSKLHRYLQEKHIQYTYHQNYPPHILGKVYIQANNIRFGKNVTIYPGAYLWGNNIEIGDNVNIGIGTIIYSNKGVRIGNNTLIAGQCYIIDSNHSINVGEVIQKQPMDVADDGITIGEDVWISAQSSILKGACIHDHAVIGAQSLVNSEIPENAIVVGTPAKVIKYRQ